MNPELDYRTLADKFRKGESLAAHELVRLYAHAERHRNYLLLVRIREAVGR